VQGPAIGLVGNSSFELFSGFCFAKSNGTVLCLPSFIQKTLVYAREYLSSTAIVFLASVRSIFLGRFYSFAELCKGICWSEWGLSDLQLRPRCRTRSQVSSSFSDEHFVLILKSFLGWLYRSSWPSRTSSDEEVTVHSSPFKQCPLREFRPHYNRISVFWK
jgi:hypothetical protein